MHTAVVPEKIGQFPVRHLPYAQLEATTADANVARNLRNCCVTSSAQLNIVQHQPLMPRIIQPSHAQGKRTKAAKSGS
jgi:hypothetical protein